MSGSNPYMPKEVVIEKITVENGAKDLKTFRLSFCDKGDRFTHECGQFAMLSVPGAGECPIGIASSPLDGDYVEFTVKRYPAGVVTSTLHGLEEGEKIGLRGPYGNSFPLKEMEGRNILIVGGGFAFTTLRATIRFLLEKQNRPRYKNITVIYGARSPGELLYKEELAAWKKRDDIDIRITVDKGDETWDGLEGFVPAIVEKAAPSAKNAVALVCGPPIMMKFTVPVLLKLGFGRDAILTSLERRMSCGMGKCGRCNVGARYVCKDGPVMSYEKLLALKEAF
jgi:sulfhydrogenase subunit gamma (sulfur reductase)